MSFFETVPWWIWLPLAAVLAGGCFHIVVAAKQFWAIRGVKSFDIATFAKQCNDYYAEWAGFASARIPASRMQQVETPDSARRQFDEEWNVRKRIECDILERFGPRAMALLHQMKCLGIPSPKPLHWLGDLSQVSMYIGQVGELLRHGLLDQARTLDPRGTWGARLTL